MPFPNKESLLLTLGQKTALKPRPGSVTEELNTVLNSSMGEKLITQIPSPESEVTTQKSLGDAQK